MSEIRRKEADLLRLPPEPTNQKEITHLRVIVGCLGGDVTYINHNQGACWSSAGFTQVMMSERVEGAERCILQMNFLHI